MKANGNMFVRCDRGERVKGCLAGRTLLSAKKKGISLRGEAKPIFTQPRMQTLDGGEKSSQSPLINLTQDFHTCFDPVIHVI